MVKIILGVCAFPIHPRALISVDKPKQMHKNIIINIFLN
jgi:hypothetical protein